MARRRRKRRVAQIRFIIATLFAVGLAACVLLGLFRIHAVEVFGSERYTPDQIREDLIYDFWTRNTLYFAWKYRAATTDPRAPYLDSIQAKVVSPGKVRLTVQEKKLAGYVQYAGQNVCFDSQGIVLDISEEADSGIPLVTGVMMGEPTLYQKLPVESAAQMSAMLRITELLAQADFLPDSISFDENLNMTLDIGQITVRLGQNDYLDEKVASLASIYPEVEGQSGTLNLESLTTGRDEDILFRPSDGDETGETDENGDPIAGTAETDENGNPIAGTGETDENGNPVAGTAETDENGNPIAGTGEDATKEGETVGLDAFMVFDSSYTLRYDAHVVNGQVVDANGTPIDGCTVNEDGYVVDAYMNVIDPYTGQPIS